MVKPKPDLSVYKQVDLETRVASATPHKLISMLFEAVVHQLRLSLTALSNNDVRAMNKALQKASELIGGLRESLNLEVDSDLPHSLDALYDYMQRRLLSARISEPESKISEVLELLITVQSGWQEIEQGAKK